MKTLLIVESPAKSKTIEKLLGSNYVVLSSFGHIRNLDKKSLGIDIEDNFRPNYRILTERSKQIKQIQDTIKSVDKVLLASDEDREGEAIAWHCAIVFKLNVSDNNRITFHEITKEALESAVANPRKIDMNMVYSQQARQILDKLIGFKLSPLLWRYIAPKLSAGRVQSVALKIIIDQEVEISKFSEKKYYKTSGIFNKNIKSLLNEKFIEQSVVNNFLNDCKSAIFTISDINKSSLEKRPPPPYTTSTIQQDACSRFMIGAKKVMSVLQKLYESGLITYHRTDSTNLSTQIVNQIKTYITDKFGKKYLHVRIYKSKIKCAQEAHEAIRPTNIEKAEITSAEFDEIDKRIYNIIWKRTVASQMSALMYDLFTITIKISNRSELFISKIEKVTFDGYRKIYDDRIKNDDITLDDSIEEMPEDFVVDQLKKDDVVNYNKISCTEKYDNPPLRYNEASLIKKMEKVGIGRPSTYAGTIETIMERKYVEKKDIKGEKRETINYTLEKGNIKNKVETITFGGEKKKLIPTDLGCETNKFLEEHFVDILDYNFTSQLEEKLDNIANNNAIWNDVIQDFYDIFNPSVVKLNNKELVAKAKDDRKRLLGKDGDNNIYAYIGKFGPVIQIGEDKDKKYLKLDEKYSVNTVTLEDYKQFSVSKYPKKIGVFEEKEVFLKNGAYGLYIQHDEKNYKLINDYDENMTLEDAIACIKEKQSIKVGAYTIKKGPYRMYILYDKKFFSIPSEYDPMNLSEEDCKKIVEIPKKKFVKIAKK
jgi:DNA topoisomerase-1